MVNPNREPLLLLQRSVQRNSREKRSKPRLSIVTSELVGIWIKIHLNPQVRTLMFIIIGSITLPEVFMRRTFEK
jgi:hypothetical protein